MTQSKKIAVTGGIGSGKSFVCTLLREYGYAVFSCLYVLQHLIKLESSLNGLAGFSRIFVFVNNLIVIKLRIGFHTGFLGIQ